MEAKEEMRRQVDVILVDIIVTFCQISVLSFDDGNIACWWNLLTVGMEKLQEMQNALMAEDSPLSVASLVFYICILIPLCQLKNAVVIRILGGVAEDDESSHLVAVPNLSVCKFEEESSSSSEEMCSICLMEFDEEDVVSRVSRCGHIFHMDCMERWLHCNHFTCPLCRSFLLINVQSSHAK
ncbi:hypothetical protein ACOSQ4_006113 [Xanthoceras sorbifolium]